MEKAKAEQVDYGGSGNYVLLFFYFPPQLEPNKLDRSCAAHEKLEVESRILMTTRDNIPCPHVPIEIRDIIKINVTNSHREIGVWSAKKSIRQLN